MRSDRDSEYRHAWRDEAQAAYWDGIRDCVQRLLTNPSLGHDLQRVLEALDDTVPGGLDLPWDTTWQVVCDRCKGELVLGQESPVINGLAYHPDCVQPAEGFRVIPTMRARADELDPREDGPAGDFLGDYYDRMNGD